MKKRKILLTAVITLLALLGACSFAFADAIVDNNTYTHDSKFNNRILIDGIDVSYAQGGYINWSKVKRAGIDYAFIRVGARSYGSTGRLIEDDYYKRNIEEAQKNGIQVGVYFFSQAINELEAQAEARYTLKLIQGYNLDLPVVMDYEFSGGSSGRLTAANLSKTQMTKNAKTFMKIIEDAGYEPMLYANLMFLRHSIYANTISAEYPIWLAQYNTYSSYADSYDYWQYTSSGNVFGISGRVDCNFWYFDPSVVTPETATTKSITSCTATVKTSSYTYTKFQKKPSVTVMDGATLLQEGVDYKLHYISNVMAGKAYAFIKGIGKYTDVKLAPFEIKQQDFSKVDITVSDATYTGSPIKPDVKVTYTGTLLKPGIDYTVTANNDGSIGTAKVTVTGKRNFRGSVNKTFTIEKGPSKITTGYNSYTRTTSNIYFLLKAQSSSGGKLSYVSSDPDVVTVTDEGRVNIKGAGTAIITIKSAATSSFDEGVKTVNVTVNKSAPTMTVSKVRQEKSINSSDFNVGAKTKSDGIKTYTSSNHDVAQVDQNGNVSIKGAGLATITITAAETKDFYSVTRDVTVIVRGGDQEITGTTNYKKTCIARDFALDVKSSGGGELSYESSDPNIATVTNSGVVDIKDTGRVTITVTAAPTEYFGGSEKEIFITVRPKKQVAKVTNPYKKKLRVYFTTDEHASGYQIKYSTSKSFSSNVSTKYVDGAKNRYRTYRIYSPGKTYYAKVRSYKIDDQGKKIYGYYSSVKSIRVK